MNSLQHVMKKQNGKQSLIYFRLSEKIYIPDL